MNSAPQSLNGTELNATIWTTDNVIMETWVIPNFNPLHKETNEKLSQTRYHCGTTEGEGDSMGHPKTYSFYSGNKRA